MLTVVIFTRTDEKDILVVFKKYVLKDYQLTFRSELCVADIEYKQGSSVQGALYEITDKDESCLDKYEDFPILYKKIFLNTRAGM